MPSTIITISEGIIVLIESDKKGEWWVAQHWQSERFIKAMEFDRMKSMGGGPIPSEKTESFAYNGFIYHFILEFENGAPPCYIVNESSGKKREIKYFDLNSGRFEIPVVSSKFKLR
jgi:hypothetical protein